jgi:hypothetical protein
MLQPAGSSLQYKASLSSHEPSCIVGDFHKADIQLSEEAFVVCSGE